MKIKEIQGTRNLSRGKLPLGTSTELKNREKHKRFFWKRRWVPNSSKNEEIWPLRHDLHAAKQNRNFFYQVMTLSRDVLLGSTELINRTPIMIRVFFWWYIPPNWWYLHLRILGGLSQMSRKIEIRAAGAIFFWYRAPPGALKTPKPTFILRYRHVFCC